MSRKLFALVTGALVVSFSAGVGPVLADGPVVVEACGADGCCRHARCPHGGVCVPTTEIKKIDKRIYSDTCEQFCLPKCPLFGFLGGHGCGGCGHDCHDGACHEGGTCHQCEHIRTRKYLVVKIKKEEQCVAACKVEHEACAAPAGTVQPMPAQPMPAKPMPAAKPTAAGQPVPQVQVLEYRYMPTPQVR